MCHPRPLALAVMWQCHQEHTCARPPLNHLPTNRAAPSTISTLGVCMGIAYTKHKRTLANHMPLQMLPLVKVRCTTECISHSASTSSLDLQILSLPTEP